MSSKLMNELCRRANAAEDALEALTPDASDLEIARAGPMTNPGSDVDIEDLNGTRPPELRLPAGFCLDEQERLCAFIPAQPVGRNKKMQPPRLLPLISNRIGAPTLRFRNGYFGIGFTATTDRGGSTEVFLTSAQCYIRHGLLRQLAKNAVMRNLDRGCAVLIEKFALGWLIKLLAEDRAIRDPIEDLK